ncbi:hypothetical protein E0Z10_g3915 [Xylaria hypoxylon]|uniref:Heterokaryon incompatibility domain-containing protein n=1 Tax=Xylaria hypoxylon TaxID=37992 RepID=A0A4Z0YLX5_9PEZI|nr:hypothetical protein E0Z10_g3915 [Xylaria hypoxylon]
MRLIHCRTLQLQKFPEIEVPPYAILSHTWDGEEVTSADFLQGPPSTTDRVPKGWVKIKETCKLAEAQGYEYVWIDTCCIDKSSSAELTEAINSMYAWYAGASKCFAYLSDFDPSTPNADLFSSRWFSRGWTLQELIAPADFEFYDSSWRFYGSKASLGTDIAYATGIDESVLYPAGRDLRDVLAAIPICQKMSWASGRETQRLEDISYCLLGIFDVHMPLIYGEGTKAFTRLQEEIMKSSNDLTILAWKKKGETLPWDRYGILAQSPKVFSDSKDIVLSQDLMYNPDFSITNKGIRITVDLPITSGIEKPIMGLYCYRQDRPHEFLGIYLEAMSGGVYSRALPDIIPVEIAGRRSRDASIFMTTCSPKGNAPSSALVRGHHFSFNYHYPSEMSNSVQLLSAYPEKRWDGRFGFRAKDAPSFVGINTYKVYWQDKTSRFVVACGFDLTIQPWACIDIEGSELWCAAANRDLLRVGWLAREQKNEEISLKSKMYIRIDMKPFYGESEEPRWMQIVLRADRKRNRVRRQSVGHHQHLVDSLEGPLGYLPEPEGPELA